jgi:aryl-alcohol dehydrogenase-like predicted oxidoreductase
METRQIGSLQVSLVGLGCNNFGWNIDYDKASRVVEAALNAGINFFDTADIYGKNQSEEFLGRALGHRRHRAIIATKFGMDVDGSLKGARPEYVRQAADASLRRLNTDRIDLYYLHKPDPGVPIAETLGALNGLVTAGKVREIACSNFTAAMLRDANDNAREGARFVAVQNEYNILNRDPEIEVLPECERLGIAFIPYFPLASGLLSGKYRRGQPAPEGSRIASGGARFAEMLTDEKLTVVESLRSFAESKGHTLLELAMSWPLARPVVASVIAGATSPEQVTANAAAARWRLTQADLAAVDALVPGARAETPMSS